MHIGEKIFSDIRDVLEDEYSIYVSTSDWEQFNTPLVINEHGEINRLLFENRQNKSIDIIKNILDIHGKGYIVNFIGRLAVMEPKIQALQPWVRDHVVHAINTFTLGVYILKNVKFPDLGVGGFDYPFMWKLCGPTHDLGYPIEIAHNIRDQFEIELNKILEEIGSSSPRIDLELYPNNLNKLCGNLDANKIIQKRLTEWGLKFDIQNYYHWLGRKRKNDHGVVSALAQLKVIDALYFKANQCREYRDIYSNGLNFNQKFFDLDIVSVSSALFVHNIDLEYPGLLNKISFNLAPLAFLLLLCDTFQEWDRHSENMPVYSGNDFNISCTHNSISLFVPMEKEVEQKICKTLRQRLTGLSVNVNGKNVIS